MSWCIRSVCVALFLPAALARGQEPLSRPKLDAKTITASASSDWYGVYHKDEKTGDTKKIGFFNAIRKIEGGKVREGFLMSMKIASFGKKVEMTLSQDMVFSLDAPHSLLKAEFTQNSGPVTLKTLLDKSEKGYTVLVQSGKVESKSDVGELDFTLADAMANEMWLKTNPKPGESISFRDFSMEDLRVDTQTAKLLSKKSSLVGGVEVPFYEVETVTLRNKLKMTTLHDEQGRLLSGQVAIFELRRETEAQAKNTEFSADLFVLGQVKVDKALGATERIEELILEVEGKGGEVLPSGPRQKVELKGDIRVLKIGKTHGTSAKASAKEIKECLEESVALPIHHAKIKELLKEAIGDAKTDEEKVRRIVAFTHNYIRPALTTNPPEIHHLIERKSGDCKCYARMFAVLARSAGVPAREVSGFVYMGDFVQAFGGHAWNEVVLGGQWVPLDASMNRTEVTAGHIYLGTEREAASILDTMGKMKLKVVEVKTGK